MCEKENHARLIRVALVTIKYLGFIIGEMCSRPFQGIITPLFNFQFVGWFIYFLMVNSELLTTKREFI